jgi:hypothetical protein
MDIDDYESSEDCSNHSRSNSPSISEESSSDAIDDNIDDESVESDESIESTTEPIAGDITIETSGDDNPDNFMSILIQSCHQELIAVGKFTHEMFRHVPEISFLTIWEEIMKNPCKKLLKYINKQLDTDKKATLTEVLDFLKENIIAWSYHISPNVLRADNDASNNKPREYIQGGVRLTSKRSKQILQALERAHGEPARGAKFKKPFDPPRISVVFTEEINKSLQLFSWPVLEAAEESDSYFITSIDDIKNASSGSTTGPSQGLKKSYNSDKTESYGYDNDILSTPLLRLVLLIRPNFYESLSTEETFVPLFKSFLEEIEADRIIFVHDRATAYTGLGKELIKLGINVIGTIQRGHPRNKYNPSTSDDKMKPGNKQGLVVMSRKGPNMIQRIIKNERDFLSIREYQRVFFMHTNMPGLSSKMIMHLGPELKITPLEETLKSSSYEEKRYKHFLHRRDEVWENANLLMMQQGTPSWMVLRRTLLTSTRLSLLIRWYNSLRLNVELNGNEFNGSRIFFGIDDSLDNWKIDVNEELYAFVNSYTADKINEHMKLLSSLFYADSERQVPVKLRPICGDSINNASWDEMLAAAKEMGVKVPNNQWTVGELRTKLREVRVDYLTKDFLQLWWKDINTSFKGNIATRSGLVLEQWALDNCADFLNNIPDAFPSEVVGGGATGTYSAVDCPSIASSADGLLFSCRRRTPDRRIDVLAHTLEFKFLSDETKIERSREVAKSKNFDKHEIKYNMSNENIKAVRAAFDGDGGYILQSIHHASVLQANGTLFFHGDVNGAENGFIRCVDLRVDSEFSSNHPRVLQLLLDFKAEFFRNSEMQFPEIPGVDKREVAYVFGLSRALVANPPGTNKVRSLKSAPVAMYNLLKTAQDTKKSSMRKFSPHRATKTWTLIAHLTSLATVEAVSIYRALLAARSVNFDASQLPWDWKQLRKLINKQGGSSIRTIVRQGLVMGEEAEDIEMNELDRRANHVIAASKATKHEGWKKFDFTDPKIWEQALKLRTAASRGANIVEAFNDPLLAQFRLTTIPGVLEHKKVVIEEDDRDVRRRCVLDCEKCERGEDHDVRKGFKTRWKCESCGVFLSDVVRESMNSEIPFEIWHTHPDLPTHPYHNINKKRQAALITSAPARCDSDSARKNRDNDEFKRIKMEYQTTSIKGGVNRLVLDISEKM